MTRQALLVELLVEELPPKALKRLGEAFAGGVVQGLKTRGLLADGAAQAAFATPRRLAVHVLDVLAQAPDQAIEHKLMPAAVGLNGQGQASPALLKKLASLGADAALDVATLERRDDGKTQTLVWKTTARGASLAQGLQATLDEVLAALPIPKVMSYQLADGWTSVSFVRPVHGLIALHGADIVPVKVLGVEAARHTQGHRFEALKSPVVIESADRYAPQMQDEGAVVLSFAERRADIARQLQQAAAALGLKPVDDEALLDEVTALVERPKVLGCAFDTDFLSVPSECLILTMKANQKYFPLMDASGRLTHRFLVVSNIDPSDASRVVEGNERVVRPRLADAKFFFDKDRKQSLDSRRPLLDKVVYHAKLGSMGDRSRRVEAITGDLIDALGWADERPAAVQAARLAKADLVSDMVGEFPELQGTMGGYYARHDQLGEAVAIAIEDHYKPRFAGDALPRNRAGLVVALADKIETLTGLFAAGERPTGDKDPFALRRHALGIIRMLMDQALPLGLPQLVDLGLKQAPDPAARDELLAFFQERLSGLLREQQYATRDIDAVLSAKPSLLADVPKRLDAVRAFVALPEAESLAAANKRVANILKKREGPSSDEASKVDPARLQDAAEQQLHAMLNQVKPIADGLFQQGEYAASLRELASLKAPVDRFFDQVMVNAEDPALRHNRLALLTDLHLTMNRVADLSKLAT